MQSELPCALETCPSTAPFRLIGSLTVSSLFTGAMNRGRSLLCKQNLLLSTGIAGGLLVGIFFLTAPATALQPTPSDTANLSTLRAKKLFVQGMTQTYLEDYEEAVSLFEDVLDLSPNTPSVLSALAEAEVGRNNLTSALYYARRARDNAPNTAYYHLALADLLREAGRTEEAAVAYQELLSVFPNHVQARRTLAHLQKNELGQPDRALQNFRVLVDSLDRPRERDYTALLDLYQTVGNEADVERTLETLIQLRRDRPLYRRLLGQLYTEQGRHEEAISLFETLLQETPNDPRLLTQLKMLYTETNQPEKTETLGKNVTPNDAFPNQLVARARSSFDPPTDTGTADTSAAVELLQKALEQTPNHPEALTLLGRIYEEQKRHAEAATLFERAIEEDPRSPDRWRYAASAHLNADSLRRAAALAEEGLLLFPGRLDLIRIEARTRLRLGENEAARTRLERALSSIDTTEVSTEDRAVLHAGLGLAQQRLGHVKDAAASYERALQLDGQQPMALKNYAYHLAQQPGRSDRALSLARRAVEIDEDDPRALDVFGWIQLKRGRYESAKSTFEAAVATGMADARVYEHFGDLHRALGNDSLAQKYWKEALDRAPTRDSLKQKIRAVPQS